jgi:hypothetical protein
MEVIPARALHDEWSGSGGKALSEKLDFSVDFRQFPGIIQETSEFGRIERSTMTCVFKHYRSLNEGQAAMPRWCDLSVGLTRS